MSCEVNSTQKTSYYLIIIQSDSGRFKKEKMEEKDRERKKEQNSTKCIKKLDFMK